MDSSSLIFSLGFFAPLFSHAFIIHCSVFRFIMSTIFLQYLILSIIFQSFVFAEDYYELLGVSRDASKEEIQKAFNKLSLKYHPDKVRGVDKEEAMKKYEAISNAYEVLSDDQQRQIYDMGGEEGLKRHEQGGPEADDPFSDIMNNFFFHQDMPHQQSQRRVQQKTIPVDLTLEEIFTGKQMDVWSFICIPFISLLHKHL